jgi:hypothetical protein
VDGQLALILGLTFIIHMVGTLAYSVRIAGTRTGRIAISLSLFNILLLVSRTSNAFQSPLLTNRVEQNITQGVAPSVADFRWILIAASLATVVGAILTPTFQRIFTVAVARFNRRRSLPAFMLRIGSPNGLAHLRDSVTLPRVSAHVTSLLRADVGLIRAALLNAVAVSIWTVGVLAPLYAAYLVPELRATAASLTPVINGVATILLFILIDPYLSIVTDDVIEGRASEAELRRTVTWMVGSRLAGTVAAQLALVPAGLIIVAVARAL